MVSGYRPAASGIAFNFLGLNANSRTNRRVDSEVHRCYKCLQDFGGDGLKPDKRMSLMSGADELHRK